MSEKQEDLLGSIISKAWSDETFKQRLLSDTNATLKAEGVNVPAGFQIRAVEDTDHVYHLVIPAKPSKPRDVGDDPGTNPGFCPCVLLADWTGLVH
jgi:Nitrile hydratase, alpha chain